MLSYQNKIALIQIHGSFVGRDDNYFKLKQNKQQQQENPHK